MHLVPTLCSISILKGLLNHEAVSGKITQEEQIPEIHCSKIKVKLSYSIKICNLLLIKFKKTAHLLQGSQEKGSSNYQNMCTKSVFYLIPYAFKLSLSTTQVFHNKRGRL